MRRTLTPVGRFELIHGDDRAGADRGDFAIDAEVSQFFLQDQRVGVERVFVELETVGVGRIKRSRRRQFITLAPTPGV